MLKILPLFSTALLSAVLLSPSAGTMAPPQTPLTPRPRSTTLSFVPGFFDHSDPATNDSTYPLLSPRFGLVEGLDWPTFVAKIKALRADARREQEEDPARGRSDVKVFWVQRHGQ
ncbi:hypothetical protein BDK51DRAFT_45428 [Blyttiomyces helicus]|uniref:Uncharacterized protein n=1 Tax=Blyttiomyces helicus TaxID=388810 RepID=A0A4P9W536_9FUNG|nr:hypothetical protein BDK51DRAFT_45428 [Blyttiomyces helicus]|eukprot:RKO87052.1 hypothetical protein BDK51DRAFT_45428 [Blyttiomyces helicus]